MQTPAAPQLPVARLRTLARVMLAIAREEMTRIPEPPMADPMNRAVGFTPPPTPAMEAEERAYELAQARAYDCIRRRVDGLARTAGLPSGAELARQVAAAIDAAQGPQAGQYWLFFNNLDRLGSFQ